MGQDGAVGQDGATAPGGERGGERGEKQQCPPPGTEPLSCRETPGAPWSATAWLKGW